MDIPNENQKSPAQRLEDFANSSAGEALGHKLVDFLEDFLAGRKRIAVRVTPDSASMDTPEGPAFLDFEFVVLDAPKAASDQAGA